MEYVTLGRTGLRVSVAGLGCGGFSRLGLGTGTIASYVLGDSVTQFSLIIGIYLFAMGVGSWLSRFIDRGLARRFVDIELAVAVLGVVVVKAQVQQVA